jgi:hypothetical protein
MAMWRVLRPMTKGDRTWEEGEVTRLEWLKPAQVEKLVEVGAVSRIAAPPLEVLPGWKARAEKLLGLELRTAEEFLEADVERIAAFMEVKPATVQRWQSELWDWLRVEPPARRGG